jgi:hypothetical protein
MFLLRVHCPARDNPGRSADLSGIADSLGGWWCDTSDAAGCSSAFALCFHCYIQIFFNLRFSAQIAARMLTTIKTGALQLVASAAPSESTS